MVAGSLRNPWAALGRCLEFGDEYWPPGEEEGAWLEHEFCAGGNGGLHEGFAGKDWAGKTPESGADYLYVEELPEASPRRPMLRMHGDKVGL